MVLPMWAFWLALVAMLVGLAGVVLPVIPGVGFIWIVILIYAIVERFATIDVFTFIVLTVLGVAGFTAEWWMSPVGAKAGGASWKALLAGAGGAALGALIGLFFLGVGAIPGLIVGSLLGIFLWELRERGEWKEALKASGGLLAGCLVSHGVQFVIGTLMILIFAWQALRG